MSTATTISTHVLDVSLGKPAENITATLERIDSHGVFSRISSYVTNEDGRVGAMVPSDGSISAGSYRLTFEVASYFADSRRESFYRTISIDFEVGEQPQHYHVPLLLSPFGYSTYRGS
ncbi:MAG: hydroxyisourate hydrolase [bacterium]